ncbi:MAG: hypothetical protein U5L76_01010 [Patescibacteria group bacterium]|nr:hypothetical protein [Patescibacteria group bacterium]
MPGFQFIVPCDKCESVINCIEKELAGKLRDDQKLECTKGPFGVIVRGIDEEQLVHLRGISGIFSVQYVA